MIYNPIGGMMGGQLPHTERTLAKLRAGKRAKAIADHNARVESEFGRAKQGEVINLSDLMAARDELEVTRPDESA